jgi:hypothetical protein
MVCCGIRNYAIGSLANHRGPLLAIYGQFETTLSPFPTLDQNEMLRLYDLGPVGLTAEFAVRVAQQAVRTENRRIAHYGASNRLAICASGEFDMKSLIFPVSGFPRRQHAVQSSAAAKHLLFLGVIAYDYAQEIEQQQCRFQKLAHTCFGDCYGLGRLISSF